MDYTPPKKILERYADVFVTFALGKGKGIKKGDVVYLVCYEYAKPLFVELRKAILKSGGHVIADYRSSSTKEFPVDRDFFDHAKESQLDFFPKKYVKGLVEEIDHSIFIICDTDMHSLEAVNPKSLMRQQVAWKPFRDWRNEKEHAGKFSWTIGLYATEAMAAEAGLSLKAYWQEIIHACFLDKPNPVAEWKGVYKKLERYRRKLNSLEIKKIHVEGPDTDLFVKIGEKRAWLGGGGANIPSFELFTSPDWRGTEGWIKFNQPLYRYGTLIEGIKLEFKKGRVIKATATKNEEVLREMIATKNADKVGEFSMTDKRFSRISKFMAETLYDENIGGPHGNTHIALGSAYKDCFKGNPHRVKPAEWTRLGYNDSAVHTDIISTSPRTITALMKDGSERVIYKNGMYTF